MTKDPLAALYDDLPPSVLAELRAFVCSTGRDADRFLAERRQRDAAESDERNDLKSRAS